MALLGFHCTDAPQIHPRTWIMDSEGLCIEGQSICLSILSRNIIFSRTPPIRIGQPTWTVSWFSAGGLFPRKNSTSITVRWRQSIMPSHLGISTVSLFCSYCHGQHNGGKVNQRLEKSSFLMIETTQFLFWQTPSAAGHAPHIPGKFNILANILFSTREVSNDGMVS